MKGLLVVVISLTLAPYTHIAVLIAYNKLENRQEDCTNEC